MMICQMLDPSECLQTMHPGERIIYIYVYTHTHIYIYVYLYIGHAVWLMGP